MNKRKNDKFNKALKPASRGMKYMIRYGYEWNFASMIEKVNKRKNK